MLQSGMPVEDVVKLFVSTLLEILVNCIHDYSVVRRQACVSTLLEILGPTRHKPHPHLYIEDKFQPFLRF